MKKVIIFCICTFCAVNLWAQKETFDLTTYTSPKGWKKQPADGAVQFTKEDAAKGNYCMITLYKAVPARVNSKENFDLAWESLVREMLTVSTSPEMQPADTKNGWEVQSGYAAFEKDGAKGIAILVTATASEKMVNILILTNTDIYEKNVSDFLTSVSLKKAETAQQQSTTTTNNNSPVVGTWGISSTTASFYNTSINEGSIIKQYTFNANGTYSFYIKTFRYLLDKLLLTRETGTYQISGTSISIAPQKSVIEAWSKKDGTDKWGKLLSSEKQELEKTTYQFVTNDFGSGPVLILKAGKVTKRDGNFNNNEKDAWFYPSKSSIEVIILPEGQQQAVNDTRKEPATQTVNGFAFSSTNFDDGWTSTVKDNWVEVAKSSALVLLHFPITLTNEIRTDQINNCWKLVASDRYTIHQFYKFDYSILKDFPYYFLQADATEKNTGKKVFVSFQVIPKNGVAWCYEIVTPSKTEFLQQFPSMDKIENMGTYNKFAVAASDFKGKWTNNFTGMQQYVNVYTGADAGMTTHASSETFEFSGNTYKWELKVASGVTGNAKFQNVKSTGKITVLNNWQVYFSEIEKKARTYNAYFSCVKGTRLLWLQDAGSGGYDSFGKVQ